MEYLFIYLLGINLFGLAIMYIDKQKAKKSKWRISEKTLFITALIGGSIGIKAGMQLFRHKTHHKQFVYGIPAIIILQLAAVVYLFFNI